MNHEQGISTGEMPEIREAGPKYELDIAELDGLRSGAREWSDNSPSWDLLGFHGTDFCTSFSCRSM